MLRGKTTQNYHPTLKCISASLFKASFSSSFWFPGPQINQQQEAVLSNKAQMKHTQQAKVVTN